MKYVTGFVGAALVAIAPAAWADQPLFVAYPPAKHETTASQIFFIGTAPPKGTVLVNGQPIARNATGNFAPSFSLKPGENVFTFRYQSQEVKISVTRRSTEPEVPTGLAFAKDSLTPATDIARLPNELLCFGAIAAPNASVSVKLADQVIPLLPQPQKINLPDNVSLLTNQNTPTPTRQAGHYQGCTRGVLLGDLGVPLFQLTIDGQTTTQPGPGKITILSPAQFQVAEVTADPGVARTGASTDYSRITPLPKGTRAAITGSEGDWLRLDYGGWINRQEVQVVQTAVPPQTVIRSVSSRQRDGWTDIIFPLQVPVPVSVQQGDRTFTLTLFNTTAQTDIIRLDDNPLVSRLDWQQVSPGQVQYTFSLKTNQQWGYTLRYEGTSLILSLRHPPKLGQGKPLSGAKILLDPGHGGPEDLGSRGPTGYPEKDVTLIMSKLVREQLVNRGATVILTREGDQDLYPQDRATRIIKEQPTIAISLHYNALPDSGDALKTQGIAAFWYNPQSHSLAVFLHNYLVQTLKRPSFGVYWDNLALARPTVAPAILLELGFMINPDEFDWITNPQAQKKLAVAIADGITAWMSDRRRE